MEETSRRLSPDGVKFRGEYELSPDGRKIVFTGGGKGSGWEIYVMNSDGRDVRQLTDNRAWDIEPIWSPDGRTIAFTSWRDGNYEIYAMQADGTGQMNLSQNPADDWSPTWVPQ